MFEALDAFLKAQDVKIEVKKDFPLRRISTIGIGGEASYVLYPRSVSQLVLRVIFFFSMSFFISSQL